MHNVTERNLMQKKTKKLEKIIVKGNCTPIFLMDMDREILNKILAH